MRLTLGFGFLLFLTCIDTVAIEVGFQEIDKLVAEKNGHVIAARQFSEASETETGFLLRSFLPKVSGIIGYERFKTGIYSFTEQPYGGVEATINIFRSGQDYLENRLRNEQYEFAMTEFKMKFRNELLEARRVYWSLLYIKELLETLNQSLLQNEKNLAAAKRRVNAGMGAETDRYEFEIYQTQLEQDISRFKLQQNNSGRALAVLLGEEPETPLVLKVTAHEHNEPILQAKLTPENQLDFQKERINETISDLKSSVAYRWWLPSLDVYANYTNYTFKDREYFNVNDRYDTVFGAKLTFLFFDGLVSRSQGRAENARAGAFHAEAAQTYRESQVKFENAQAQLKLTHELLHGIERNVLQSEKYLHGTLSEYQRGIKNSADVLSASQRFLEFQRRLIELKRDYNTAHAELMANLNR